MDGVENGSSAMGLDSKRFIVTSEQQPKARLAAFRQALTEARAHFPEIVGATLYGSMVKDTAHEGSDVDAYIFVDLDAAKQHFTSEDYRLAEEEAKTVVREEQAQRQQIDTENPAPIQAPRVEDLIARKRYRPGFVSALEKTGLAPDDMKDIRVRVLSQEVINQDLSMAVKQELKLVDWEKQLVEVNKTDFNNYWEWTKNNPRPNFRFGDLRISSLFHLAIGRNLDQYRGYVLDFLSSNGASGERVWKGIIGRTADMERSFVGSNYQNLYPQTIDSAKAYYHLNGRTKADDHSTQTI